MERTLSRLCKLRLAQLFKAVALHQTKHTFMEAEQPVATLVAQDASTGTGGSGGGGAGGGAGAGASGNGNFVVPWYDKVKHLAQHYAEARDAMLRHPQFKDWLVAKV